MAPQGKTKQQDVVAGHGPVSVAGWNLKYGPGTRVRYFPIMGENESIVTATRSVAWALGHGEAVVLIEQRTGGVSLRHLAPLPCEGCDVMIPNEHACRGGCPCLCGTSDV